MPARSSVQVVFPLNTAARGHFFFQREKQKKRQLAAYHDEENRTKENWQLA
jgi:hypothetical protein